MGPEFDDVRSLNSPFVETVWRARTVSAGTFTSVAASRWEMVVVTFGGKTTVVARGPETRTSEADYPADAEYLGITFELGAFMPHLPVRTLLDRRDATLPGLPSARRSGAVAGQHRPARPERGARALRPRNVSVTSLLRINV